MGDELTEMRDLVDLAHQALEALLSTRWRPADAPAWLWDVMGELHRVGGHGEDPHHERTRKLMQEVLDAYDEQQGTAHWEEAGDDELAKTLPTLDAVALRRVSGTDHPAAHQPQLSTAVARWYSEHHPDWRNDVDAAVDGVLDLVELIRERRQGADVQRATDRLRRVARDIATNSEEAERAGLAGDARRWWTVRSSIVAALQMLGAPLPRPTVTVDVTPADLAAEEVRVRQVQWGDEPLRVGDAAWVCDRDGTTWEGTVRGRAADDSQVWRIRLWLGATNTWRNREPRSARPVGQVLDEDPSSSRPRRCRHLGDYLGVRGPVCFRGHKSEAHTIVSRRHAPARKDEGASGW
jgi:hypothetical protein